MHPQRSFGKTWTAQARRPSPERLDNVIQFTRPTPRPTPEPTVVERRIAEVQQAMLDGGLTLLQSQIGVIILSLLVPFKNGDFGIRNQHGNVLTESMIAEIYLARFGKTVSRQTINAAKVRLVELFRWFGWMATPKGAAYQMDPDGGMLKRGIRVWALPNEVGTVKNSTQQKLSMKETEPKTVYGETGNSPPPDPVAVKLARLAAWEPDDDAFAFGWSLGQGERYVWVEADRYQAWFVNPDHPERRAWAPADPAAKFLNWLEQGAARQAKRKVEREAMDRAEAARDRYHSEYDQDDDDDENDPTNEPIFVGTHAHAYADDPADEETWRLMVVGSDDPPPMSRAEIIAQMAEIAPYISTRMIDGEPS